MGIYNKIYIMSLDVSIISQTSVIKKGTGVFIRDNGKTRELTIEEIREKYPDAVIEEQEYETEEVYSSNITHNLGQMADEAGIYDALWRPYKTKHDYVPFEDYNEEYYYEESQTIYCDEIIPIIEKGLAKLKSDPKYYKQFDSDNGWGTYEGFVPFVEDYLEALKQNPKAIVKVNR